MPDARLYDTDYYAWTQEQAAQLRRLREERVNSPLDLEHLAEEIEDLGNDTLDKIEGLVVQILAHLLKLQHCPDPDPRNHWAAELVEWRATVVRRAQRSPTVLKRLDLGRLHGTARRIVATRHRDSDWAASLPEACPHTLEQVLDPDWLPAGP